MTECAFEEYLFEEREKRWETMEKIEQKVNYLLSSDNDACYGVKELSYLEENIISSFYITALFLLKSQDMINQ